jgi:cysteine dioxygenase
MTISELTDKITIHLQENSLKDFKNQLEDFNFDSIAERIEFDSEKYKKVILHQVDLFEIILICWLPHQQTPKHKHPDNGCLMKLFQGQLNDIRITEAAAIETIVNANEITYIEGAEIHTISNMTEKSISLHIYAPGNFYN